MPQPGDSRDNTAEWTRLHELQRELRVEIGNTTDPEERARLQHRLVDARLALAQLDSEKNVAEPAAAPSDVTEVPEAPPLAPTGAPAADDGADSEIDDLIDALTGAGTVPLKPTLPPRPPMSWRTVATAVGVVGILLSVGLSWLAFNRTSSGADVDASATSTTLGAEGDINEDLEADIRAVLTAVGLGSIDVEAIGSTVHLRGSVPTAADVETATGAAQALLPDGVTLDASALTVGETTVLAASTSPEQQARATAFQAELYRILASTPLIFDLGASELTPLHQRILNSAALVVNAYPELAVTVVGYTDGQGDPEANHQLSLRRAEAVKAYLQGQGVDGNRLTTEARGEGTSTGSADLASLERRVELEVAMPGTTPPADAGKLRIGVVAPSAANDMAFTQSMVDAVNLLASERGNTEVDVSDKLFVPAEAAAAVRRYADEGYDLVIAHGVEFGPELTDIVRDHPDTTFAWGTAVDTFGLPNLYAYDAAAEQGGYVMGAMSQMLSAHQVIGVVGPIEVGDAKRYVNGFQAGAKSAVPTTTVLVDYTGSFGDIALAAEAATTDVGLGADVLTGTGEMVVGAISVAQANGALWFGTQASQASLAPQNVVASQIYRWEVVLRPIVADIDAGARQGRSLVADMANGGLVIEYNPGYALAPDVKAKGDELVNRIVAGTLVAPRG
ncbi:MAG: BMP family ABC transporter substrate-binding protein [Acidimicrobiales bacterium]